MESMGANNKRKSVRVLADLSVLSRYNERNLAMWTENISRDGMFLFSREYVSPRAVFSAQIWLSDQDIEPLQTFLTACFVERTSRGFGIGACLSGISMADRKRWEAHYQHLKAHYQHLLASCRAARATPMQAAPV